MRKLLILLIVAIITIPSFAATILINGEKSTFNKIDIKDNDVVFVSLRDLEQIGLGTIKQSGDGGIEFSTSKMNLLFYKDSDSVKMNSLSLKLPMSTYLEDGKLMVPLSFVVKSLGAEYDQETDLIIHIDNLSIPKKTELKAPTLEQPTSNSPVTEGVSTPAEPEKVVTDYQAPSLDGNWFQGIVMAYGKRLNLIDVDLYNSNNKLVQTTKSTEGAFAFKGLDDGKYYIKIDHAKNPSFKTFTTAPFNVKDMEGNKIKKPLNIYRAIKSNGCKPNEVKGQKCYMFTWNEVPNVANYKVIVSSSNPKAKVAKYDKKVEKINIPISDISKGQTYGVSVIAYDKYGNKIGESVDSGWTFESK
ncbi:MAG: hypothetical protein IJS60_02995 [Abditibacteriota bacterium]|nr:hypothetical protein [Abditibacteriota bacterium]